MALEPTGLLVVRPWDVTPSKAQGVGCPKRPSGRLKEVPPPHHCVKLEGLSQGRVFFVMEDFQDKGLRVHDCFKNSHHTDAVGRYDLLLTYNKR